MGYYGDYGHGPYGMMGYGYGAGWFGWIFMVLFWVLVVIAFVVLIRWMMYGRRREWHGNGAGGDDGADHSAMNILKERYAKGEINKEEFEEKKKDLSAE